MHGLWVMGGTTLYNPWVMGVKALYNVVWPMGHGDFVMMYGPWVVGKKLLKGLTFGDKIRHFEGNVSEMKQLTGHNFEDLLQVHDPNGVDDRILITALQCIIPCIEGLFPKLHNTSVIKLLFIFAMWHTLAKLHIHTDMSLRLLDTATTALGNALQYFV